MTRKWILYDKEERQVEWPPCVKKLSSVENARPLGGDLFMRVREDFWCQDTFDEVAPSVQSLLILGTCCTARYLQCPNIPDYHRENAQCGPRLYAEDRAEYAKRCINSQVDYFKHIGMYYWVDFDVLTADKTLKKLRMVVNVGCADTNDGMWGEVWQRNNGKQIADIYDCGDCETCISGGLEKLIRFVIEVVMYHS